MPRTEESKITNREYWAEVKALMQIMAFYALEQDVFDELGGED